MRSARAAREVEPAALSDEVLPVPIDGEPVLELPVEPVPIELLPEDVLPLVVLPVLPVLPAPVPPIVPLPLVVPLVVPVPEEVLPEVVPPVELVPELVPEGGALVPGVVTPGGALRLVGSPGLLPPELLLPELPPVEPLPLVWARASPLAMARQAAATMVAFWSFLLICLISWWIGNGNRPASRRPGPCIGTAKAVPVGPAAGIPLAAAAPWNVKSN